MTWIDDNKGQGPWDFEKQTEKPSYNQGNLISHKSNTVWETDFLSNSARVDNRITPIHDPCGYWPFIEIVEIGLPEESGATIYIVDAASWAADPAGAEDVLIAKNKPDFSLTGYQGGKGCGNDQYYCPRGCCTDGEFVWVADTKCNRVMKRTMDLGYASHFGSSGWHDDMKFKQLTDVAVDADYTYDIDFDQKRLIQRSKSDPTVIIKKLDGTEGDSRTHLSQPYGVDVDSTHVYVADFGHHRILKLLKSDFSFVADWGYGVETLQQPMGIATDGTYLYVGDYYLARVNKIEIADPTNVIIGSLTDPLDFLQPMGVGVGDTYLYVCDYGNERIQKILASDMSLVTYSPISSGNYPYEFGDINYPVGVAVETDGSFIYVTDYNMMVTKFNGDFSPILWSGDPTGNTDSGTDAYNYPSEICIDATYAYIHDLYNARIVKRLKSDLSYVSEYDFSSYVNIPGDIQGLTCDGTYLYAITANGTNRIHRINSTTMVYVDSYSNAAECYLSKHCCVNGTDLYVTDYGVYRGEIDIFDTTNLAGGVQDTITDGYKGGDYILNNAFSVIVDANYVYAVDSHYDGYGLPSDEHRIVKINKHTGGLVASQKFSDENLTVTLDYPTYIAVDEQFIYVTEREKSRAVHVFNKEDLSWVSTDSYGALGTYCYPWGICNYYNYEGRF